MTRLLWRLLWRLWPRLLPGLGTLTILLVASVAAFDLVAWRAAHIVTDSATSGYLVIAILIETLLALTLLTHVIPVLWRRRRSRVR